MTRGRGATSRNRSRTARQNTVAKNDALGYNPSYTFHFPDSPFSICTADQGRGYGAGARPGLQIRWFLALVRNGEFDSHALPPIKKPSRDPHEGLFFSRSIPLSRTCQAPQVNKKVDSNAVPAARMIQPSRTARKSTLPASRAYFRARNSDAAVPAVSSRP